MRAFFSCVVGGWVLTGAGCAPPVSQGGYDAPDPASRTYAMQRTVRTDDDSPETLRRVVELLDSDDPAVRMMAISTLEHLTGETLGYRYHASRSERDAAIRDWVRFVEARERDTAVPKDPAEPIEATGHG
jgi:hypothetical protein